MATRKQKRAKRMRARQHQKDLVDTTRRVVYEDGTEIDYPRGRRRHAGSNYRRHHPPKHGDRLDARGYLLRDLADLGITNPNDDIIREYSRLLKRAGGNRLVAKAALAENLEKIMKRAVEQMRDRNLHGFDVVDRTTGERVNPADVKAIEPPAHPTVEEWNDLVDKSKRRKRGIAKFAEKAGYKLVGVAADPKQRESWVKA